MSKRYTLTKFSSKGYGVLVAAVSFTLPKKYRFFLPGKVFGQDAELNPNPDNGTVRIQSRIRIRMIGLSGSIAESESG